MGGKNNHAAHAVPQVFQNSSGQTVSIKGRRSPTQLVDNDQAALGGRSQYGRRFEHFRHKGADSPLLQISGTHAGKNSVANVDGRRCARDVAPDLRHANNGAQRPDVDTLSPHVRTAHQQLRLLRKRQCNVVGDVFHVLLEFYTRMPGTLQPNSGAVIVAIGHNGFAIAVRAHGRRVGQGTKDVQGPDGFRYPFDAGRVGGGNGHGVPDEPSRPSGVLGLQVLVLCRQLAQFRAGKVHPVLEDAVDLDFLPHAFHVLGIVGIGQPKLPGGVVVHPLQSDMRCLVVARRRRRRNIVPGLLNVLVFVPYRFLDDFQLAVHFLKFLLVFGSDQELFRSLVQIQDRFDQSRAFSQLDRQVRNLLVQVVQNGRRVLVRV
mmetsp:Transcript_6165/g.13287  ORF Transcript_6165/g.13287 Transcript_6165/m.13287 type:complete len:374 (-) Transcript_6165:31-1152(-)